MERDLWRLVDVMELLGADIAVVAAHDELRTPTLRVERTRSGVPSLDGPA